MDSYLRLYTPIEIERIIAKKVKEIRLSQNLKRDTLAEKSGVSASSIKRFETIGKISLTSLLKIANILDCLDQFLELFPEKEITTMAELEAMEKIKKNSSSNRVRGTI